MKILNFENMVDAYYNSNCNSKIWESFRTMHKLGFIPEEEFEKFYRTCTGWYYDYEEHCVYNIEENGTMRMVRR